MRGNISSCLLALILGFNVTAVMSSRGSFSIHRGHSPVHINPRPRVYNPRVYNPAVYNPAVYNPAVYNPAVYNPAVYNPAVYNPAVYNPRPPVSNPRLNPVSQVLCYRESAVQLPAIQPEECQNPFDQNMSIILSCPPSVEGNVTWSRKTNGSKVDMLTADGDKGKKNSHDLDGRYSLLANKSLVILRAAFSDAGRYFCNSKAAGELTVMNSVASKHHKYDLMDEVSTVNYGILVLASFSTAFIVFVLSVCHWFYKQGNKGKRHVRGEVQDGLECQPRNECSA